MDEVSAGRSSHLQEGLLSAAQCLLGIMAGVPATAFMGARVCVCMCMCLCMHAHMHLRLTLLY